MSRQPFGSDVTYENPIGYLSWRSLNSIQCPAQEISVVGRNRRFGPIENCINKETIFFDISPFLLKENLLKIVFLRPPLQAWSIDDFLSISSTDGGVFAIISNL